MIYVATLFFLAIVDIPMVDSSESEKRPRLENSSDGDPEPLVEREISRCDAKTVGRIWLRPVPTKSA